MSTTSENSRESGQRADEGEDSAGEASVAEVSAAAPEPDSKVGTAKSVPKPGAPRAGSRSGARKADAKAGAKMSKAGTKERPPQEAPAGPPQARDDDGLVKSILGVILYHIARNKWILLSVLGIFSVVVALVVTGFIEAESKDGRFYVRVGRPGGTKDGPPLQVWEQQLKESAERCASVQPEQEQDRCLVDAIVQREPPPPARQRPHSELLRDAEVGAVLLDSPATRSLMYRRLGVDPENFLGSGFSRPWSTPYHGAIAHEYLIPNLEDSHKYVWTWVVDPIPVNYAKKLVDIIGKEKATKENYPFREVYEKYIDGYLKRSSLLGSDPPVVVRISRLTEREYSKRIAKSERWRAFGMNLADVSNMTLAEAAKASGYGTEGARPEDRLYIWVFVTTSSGDAIPATWQNILRNLHAWEQQSRRQQ